MARLTLNRMIIMSDRICSRDAYVRMCLQLQEVWYTFSGVFTINNSTEARIFTSMFHVGVPLQLETVKEPGTTDGKVAVMQAEPVYLALHGIHMDYIMRSHVTHWYGPSAHFPGGWCKCSRGYARVRDATAVRSQGCCHVEESQCVGCCMWIQVRSCTDASVA